MAIHSNKRVQNKKEIKQPDQMASYWLCEWPTVLVILLFGVLFNGFASQIMIMQGKLVDTFVYEKGVQEITRAGSLFLLVVFAIQGMRAVKRYSVRVFANRTMKTMRGQVYQNLLGVDGRDKLQGEMINRAILDVDYCVEGMRKVTTEVFDTGVLMTGYFITMLGYQVRITLISCIFIPIAIGIAQVLKVKIVACVKAARSQSSKVSEQTYENLSHMTLYRTYGVGDIYQKRYVEELKQLEKLSVKAEVFENSMQPIYSTIASLGVAAVLYCAGNLVSQGIWTIGTFSAYLGIFIALTIKAGKVAKLFNSYQKAVVSWKRVQPYLQPVPKEEAEDCKDKEKVCLMVRNLSFSYPGDTKQQIKELSFQAQTGTIIGVTGEVASGKSALGLALTGSLPYQGSVCVHGLELRDLTAYQRSKRISYMGHRPMLFSDSIYQNITLGDTLDITSVLMDVCMTEEIKAMPDGQNTLVGNGGIRLSGGQQARIALARALWQPSGLLILDDPFSAVDKTTEKEIMANLRTHYFDRTCILISHRLQFFPTLEHIIFLGKDGIYQGTHEELIKKCPEYATLYCLQETKGGAEQ